MSRFWFDRIRQAGITGHHLVSADVDEFPEGLKPFRRELEGRSSLVKKCEPLAIEMCCQGVPGGIRIGKSTNLVRTVCGIKLPPGLLESSELPEPIFTPATKAVTGHDENIDFERAAGIVGRDTAEKARDLSLKIYNDARDICSFQGDYNL